MGDGIWLVWQAAADACAAANCISLHIMISITHPWCVSLSCAAKAVCKQYMIADSGLMHRMSTY
jgi:hypothetical protein